jgi:hypothetical protein
VHGTGKRVHFWKGKKADCTIVKGKTGWVLSFHNFVRCSELQACCSWAWKVDCSPCSGWNCRISALGEPQ